MDVFRVTIKTEIEMEKYLICEIHTHLNKYKTSISQK